MSSRADRVINGILVIVALLTAGSVIMLLIALPAIFGAKNSSLAVAESSELAACRAEFRADIDDADTRLAVANSKLTSLLPVGLSAAMTDPSQIAEVLESAKKARAEIDDALEDLLAASDVYRDALSLSRSSPKRFLAECDKRGR